MTSRHDPGARGLFVAIHRAALCCLIAWGVGGCVQSIPWFATVLAPPEKHVAIFKPPKDKKILVLVEDRPRPINYDALKVELMDKINQQLIDHKVAASVVPSERLQELSVSTNDFGRLSTSEIGQRLGADLVLYVQIDRFTLKDDATTLWQGRLATSVWMVDVKEGRIWPKERVKSSGYPVGPIELQPEEDSSVSFGTEITRKLTNRMSDRIAKLFYDYESYPEEEEKTRKGETKSAF
jgi:hypothetical protein